MRLFNTICILFCMMHVNSYANELKVSIQEPTHHDISAPLRTLQARTLSEEKIPSPHRYISPYKHFEYPAIQNDKLELRLNFEGMGEGFQGPSGLFRLYTIPPDSSGALGTNHFVQTVNYFITVFNKSGFPVLGPILTKSLWNRFGGECESITGGGTVSYDQIAHRWVISHVAVAAQPYLVCLAISTSDDPTGSYYRYAYTYTHFPDYPRIAVWLDSYYATLNLFTPEGNALGTEICAYDRTSMLVGNSSKKQCFFLESDSSLLTAKLIGPQLPPADSPSFTLSLSHNSLNLWKFHVNWSDSTKTKFIGPIKIPVAPFEIPCKKGACIPQLNTTQKLDALADRLSRIVYRNFGDHESLAISHTITANDSIGVRWYEIRNPNTKPVVSQYGTYAPDNQYRWLSSISMDKMGGIALGYSISSETINPGIRITGRTSNDPEGTMNRGEVNVIDGTGSQLHYENWGNFSSLSLDTDECTFFYTNQYLKTTGSYNWHTRIASFKLPGCDDDTLGSRIP